MLKTIWKRIFYIVRIQITIFFACFFPVQPLYSAETIELGWATWSDTEVVSKLAKKVIEENLGYCVKLHLDKVDTQFNDLINKKLDVMVMAWLPSDHQGYFLSHTNQFMKLGVLYSGVQFGLAVPDYVPKDMVRTIYDLKKNEIKQKLNHVVHSIDLRPNVNENIAQTFQKYGLDEYQFLPAASDSIYTSLEHALRNDEWVVVSAWTPHWVFSKWKLRQLEDPKGVMKDTQMVYALGRAGLNTDHPKIADFFSRMQIPIHELERLMYKANETTFDKAVNEYYDQNQERIRYWVTGQIK